MYKEDHNFIYADFFFQQTYLLFVLLFMHKCNYLAKECLLCMGKRGCKKAELNGNQSNHFLAVDASNIAKHYQDIHVATILIADHAVNK